MNTKTCNFDEFLGYVKSIAETQQEGTFEDFVEGLRVFDKERVYKIYAIIWKLKGDKSYTQSAYHREPVPKYLGTNRARASIQCGLSSFLTS